MIRLKRVPPPVELTPERIKVLTDAFVIDLTKTDWAPKSVKKVIKRQLKAMGRNKCAYCEVKIGRNSEWAGCDHYLHKVLYRAKVLAWQNLLPCCPRCNSQKGTLDVAATPIVNPRFMAPAQYLYLEVYLLDGRMMSIVKGKPNVPQGINTEIELALNKYDLTEARDEYLTSLVATVGDLARYLDDTVRLGISLERVLNLQRRFAAVLGAITPKNQYAGTVASYLLIMPAFEKILQFLRQNDAWTIDLERKLAWTKKHQLNCVVIQP